ncbi:MAG: DUF5686 and carboxypeptidase regulatory-like domain-containing protein [Chitinophagaceae bacterium]
MRKLLLIILFINCIESFAGEIKGVVTDTKNTPLAYASILVKGTAKGTTANVKGEFSINVGEGSFTIVCQHIGYKSFEKKIKMGKENQEINFQLEEQQYNLNDVVIKTGGEDPAYEIIRKAIKKRDEHLNEIKKFECEVYVKGQIQLRNYPKKFLGETVDFEDGDTSKRKIIFLSESVAKYSVDGKSNRKIEVVSTRVSGSSDGFGLANPQIISFYQNIISVGRGLNPRGFISPLSDNALHYYKYKYEGTFFENDKMVNRIKVIPKRTYEPLFTGYINIIEDEWRIQSTDLFLLKAQQLQFLDTLKIQQLYVPLGKHWTIKQQVISPAGKFFSFDFFGNIVQVYNKFNTSPTFEKGFFDNVIMKFQDSSNKRSATYWDSTRPLPLLESEVKDYKKKDSLEQAHKDPKYLDSIDRRDNKIGLTKLLLTGQTFSNTKKKSNIYIEPLLTSFLQFNTVEGLVANLNFHYNKEFSKKNKLAIHPNLRYGFSNTHFNANVNTYYSFGKIYPSSLNLRLGSDVFQFDNNNPISVLDNTLSTLRWTNNYMKIYEARFFKLNYSKGFNNGLSFSTNINYQHRLPLENTSDYYWRKIEGREFTANYPAAVAASNITEHKAFSATATISWKPGAKYIEFPDRKVNIGSKYPTFSFSFTQGLKNVLGSDVDYSKWQFAMNDNLNLKLGGRINYNLKLAGFAHASQVFVPDMNHVLGNQIATASSYLNSFQLMPYYAYSNTAKLYSEAHIEYHLDGLLTNKIPLFKKLNWFFVLGGNAFYNNDTKQGYYEAMFSVENVFKVIRVDFVKSFPNAKGDGAFGVKFSMPLLGGR